MKELKFRNYDSGFVRCYFKHSTKLYCIQAGYNYLPELLVCTRDGEPSRLVEDCNQFEFTNLPPDGDTWSWDEIISFFKCKEIATNGQLIKCMHDFFEVTA